jgi:hypothetical protein
MRTLSSNRTSGYAHIAHLRNTTLISPRLRSWPPSPSKRGAAEVEVRATTGANPAGALVGDGAAGADAGVEAADLVAGAAALAVLEQNRAHRAHARLHRHHVHQHPVPARPACLKEP